MVGLSRGAVDLFCMPGTVPRSQLRDIPIRVLELQPELDRGIRVTFGPSIKIQLQYAINLKCMLFLGPDANSASASAN